MKVERRASLSILPIFLSIGVYIFTSSQVYVWLEKDLSLTNAYNTALALGAILMGFLSDAFCRRKILIFIHLLALFFFFSFSRFPNHIFS